MKILSGQLSDVLEIKTELTKSAEMSGIMSESCELTAVLTGESMLSGELNAFADYPVYDGINEITPKAYQVTRLETNGRRMTNDIIVKKVPYFETSNSSGETVYIAGE